MQIVQRRGSGRTTKQMKEAPKGALFIWCTEDQAYAEQFASALGRGDLVVLPRRYLMRTERNRLSGREFPALILDHYLADTGLDDEQWEGYLYLLNRVRTLKPATA